MVNNQKKIFVLISIIVLIICSVLFLYFYSKNTEEKLDETYLQKRIHNLDTDFLLYFVSSINSNAYMDYSKGRITFDELPSDFIYSSIGFYIQSTEELQDYSKINKDLVDNAMYTLYGKKVSYSGQFNMFDYIYEYVDNSFIEVGKSNYLNEYETYYMFDVIDEENMYANCYVYYEKKNEEIKYAYSKENVKVCLMEESDCLRNNLDKFQKIKIQFKYNTNNSVVFDYIEPIN